jgi:hypothetical protein
MDLLGKLIEWRKIYIHSYDPKQGPILDIKARGYPSLVLYISRVPPVISSLGTEIFSVQCRLDVHPGGRIELTGFLNNDLPFKVILRDPLLDEPFDRNSILCTGSLYFGMQNGNLLHNREVAIYYDVHVRKITYGGDKTSSLLFGQKIEVIGDKRTSDMTITVRIISEVPVDILINDQNTKWTTSFVSPWDLNHLPSPNLTFTHTNGMTVDVFAVLRNQFQQAVIYKSRTLLLLIGNTAWEHAFLDDSNRHEFGSQPSPFPPLPAEKKSV